MADQPIHKHAFATAAWAKWLIVAVLACAAGMLLVELGRTARAAGGLTSAPAGGKALLLVAAQISPDSYGVYLVEAEKGTICVYQYQPTVRKLRLLASRNFTYDLQLDDYNTQPLPREIKELVDQQGRLGAGAKLEPTSEPVEE